MTPAPDPEPTPEVEYMILKITNNSDKRRGFLLKNVTRSLTGSTYFIDPGDSKTATYTNWLIGDEVTITVTALGQVVATLTVDGSNPMEYVYS